LKCLVIAVVLQPTGIEIRLKSKKGFSHIIITDVAKARLSMDLCKPLAKAQRQKIKSHETWNF